MAISCSLPLIKIPLLPSIYHHFLSSQYNNHNLLTSSSSSNYKRLSSYRFPPGRRSIEDIEENENDDVVNGGSKFTEAVELFNSRDYHACHDYLEDLWNDSEDPIRFLIHGILQCAVGFHHLFNQVIFSAL